MRVATRLAVAAFVFCQYACGIAATNGLDQHFGANGVVIPGRTAAGQQMAAVKGIAVQSDGKILLAGGVAGQSSNPTVMPAVGRLTADGAWDESFGDHGLTVLESSNVDAPDGGIANRIVVQSDGGIVVAGGVYRPASSGGRFHSCTLLMKLTDGGLLDTRFGGEGTGARCFAFFPENPSDLNPVHADDIKAGPADSIYLSSPSVDSGGPLVARFSPQGVLDADFGTAGIASVAAGAYAWLAAVQSDQSIVAVGSRQLSSSSWVVSAARFDASGVLDADYGVNGEFDLDLLDDSLVNPEDAALDDDNRLLIGDNNAPFGQPYRLVRVTAQGTLDTTFNGAGQQPGFPGCAKLSLSDSTGDELVAARPVLGRKLFVVGQAPAGGPASPHAMALIRLDDDAGFDTSFGDVAHPGWAALEIGGGQSPTNDADSMTIDGEGRVLIGASFSNADDFSIACAGVVRVIADELFGGSFDPTVPWPTCGQ